MPLTRHKPCSGVTIVYWAQADSHSRLRVDCRSSLFSHLVKPGRVSQCLEQVGIGAAKVAEIDFK